MTRLSWFCLPPEMRIMAMMHAPDLTTLNNLLLVDPNLVPFFERSFTHFLPRLLCQSPDLEPLVIDQHLIQQAGKIEYFTRIFLATRCKPPNDGIPGSYRASEPTPSATEEARLHCAFWLFQVHCDLSKAWASSKHMDKVLGCLHSRERLLRSYLCEFMPWVLEELESVYDHLAELLDRKPQDPRLDAEARPHRPFSLQESIDTIPKAQNPRDVHGANAKLLSQGLGFFYTYIRKTTVDDRAKEAERLLGFPNKFLINTLRELC